MLSRNCALVGVLLLIATQVKSYELLEEVIARARDNLALYESGTDVGKPPFQSNAVALDIGNLNNETFPKLPEDLKIGIAGANKAYLDNAESSYDEVLANLTQSPLLMPLEDNSLKRMDKFLPETRAWWDILGKSDATKMKELNDWFLKLISDPEFLAVTHLNAGSSLSMAKATTLIYKNLKKSCGDDEEGTKTRDIIDLAVLQYPQSEDKHFVLHHITLHGWVDCGSMKGGITGEYKKREFITRLSILSRLKQKVKDNAVRFAGDFFADIAPKGEASEGESTTTMPNVPSTSKGSSGKSSTMFTSTAAAFTTAATITKKYGDDDDEDDEEDDEDEVCE